MPRNERTKTRKARLEKGQARKAVVKALEQQNKAALKNEEVVVKNGKEEVIPAGPIQQFILSKDNTLRLAKIVSVESHTVFNIKFSEQGETMQGVYSSRSRRNFSRKQKTAAQKKLESHLLPGPDSYIIVQWDEEHARRNKERRQANNKFRIAAANIVAIIPKNKIQVEEMAMKVANKNAKRAGEPKPWPLAESLFNRKNENENENENESESESEEE